MKSKRILCAVVSLLPAVSLSPGFAVPCSAEPVARAAGPVARAAADVAQDTTPLLPGTRVRARASRMFTPWGGEVWAGRPAVGPIDWVGPDSIRVGHSDPDSSVVIALADLETLEVSRGKKSNWAKGALIGGAIGALSGVAYVASWCSEGGCDNQEGDMAAFAALYGAAGAAVGAGFGALSRPEKWKEVAPERLIAPRADVVAARQEPNRRDRADYPQVQAGAAEEAARELEGQRVRVSAPHYTNSKYVGTLQRIGADSMWVLAEGATTPVVFPLGAVEKLEISQGRRSKWLKGTAIGFGIGAAFGVGINYAFRGGGMDGGAVAEAALRSGALGAVFGLIVGLKADPERWKRMDVPAVEPMVALVPWPDESLVLMAGLRIRF